MKLSELQLLGCFCLVGIVIFGVLIIFFIVMLITENIKRERIMYLFLIFLCSYSLVLSILAYDYMDRLLGGIF